jgi:ABC-type phosphate/phosphonate transport system substrate-binding protein
MLSRQSLPSGAQYRFVLCALGVAVITSVSLALAQAAPGKIDVLHVGTSGTLTGEKSSREKGALESLKSFIKEVTELDNDITRQKDWRELTDKMAKGQLHIGVFQGYEFAWAQKEHPELKPLALAINLYRYPVVYVVTARDNKAKDFAGLQGQSVSLPDTGQPYLHLFAAQEAKAQNKDLKDFFSKTTAEQSVEDSLDNVVDGTVQAAVVDRAALEAYKQRKPGRFNKLKEVAKSKPFPPVIIAFYDKVLDDGTLKRFRDGLEGAGKTERGRTMMNLFHLTAFESAPDDFANVLAETLKEYPAPKGD